MTSQHVFSEDDFRYVFAREWQLTFAAPTMQALPPDSELKVEVSFFGRSNVGKSSLLGALCQQRKLTRTSGAPGRTRELLAFETSGVPIRIVDMPGYGFSRAPLTQKRAMSVLNQSYCAHRTSLHRVFLLLDIRRGITPLDEEVMEFLDHCGTSYQCVLTKVDTVSATEQSKVAARVREALLAHVAAYPELLLTSARKRLGLEALRSSIWKLFWNTRARSGSWSPHPPPDSTTAKRLSGNEEN